MRLTITDRDGTQVYISLLAIAGTGHTDGALTDGVGATTTITDMPGRHFILYILSVGDIIAGMHPIADFMETHLFTTITVLQPVLCVNKMPAQPDFVQVQHIRTEPDLQLAHKLTLEPEQRQDLT